MNLRKVNQVQKRQKLHDVLYKFLLVCSDGYNKEVTMGFKCCTDIIIMADKLLRKKTVIYAELL